MILFKSHRMVSCSSDTTSCVQIVMYTTTKLRLVVIRGESSLLEHFHKTHILMNNPKMPL